MCGSSASALMPLTTFGQAAPCRTVRASFRCMGDQPQFQCSSPPVVKWRPADSTRCLARFRDVSAYDLCSQAAPHCQQKTVGICQMSGAAASRTIPMIPGVKRRPAVSGRVWASLRCLGQPPLASVTMTPWVEWCSAVPQKPMMSSKSLKCQPDSDASNPSQCPHLRQDCWRQQENQSLYAFEPHGGWGATPHPPPPFALLSNHTAQPWWVKSVSPCL